MLKIIEKNPVTTHISDGSVIKELLSYKAEYWKNIVTKEGMVLKRKEKKIYYKSLVAKGLFLAGFQQRVFQFLKQKQIPFEFDKPDYKIKGKVGDLKGITFRGDQKEALNVLIGAKRGVWQAPTASGKTILICGLVKAFLTSALVIVHTTDLFHQTLEELQRFFDPDLVGRFGLGDEEIKEITVGMIQTLNKREFPKDQWGMVICDECHHVNSFSGSYFNVLKRIMAPMRFGFTATLPQTEEGKLALEGLIGPVVGKTSYEELQEVEVLAKPILKLYKVPESDRYKDMKGGYKVVYEAGIVRNRARNKLIVDEARELIEQGRTVLVMVEMVSHGYELLDMFEALMPGVFAFVHGSTESEIRQEEKQAFGSKTRRGVIATRVWSEGTNIRTIGAVINAIGGESEIASIQRFGRGMRKAEGKNDVILVDFFDTNHKWFLKHSGNRICTYMEWGLL